jgi:hypothetical protein
MGQGGEVRRKLLADVKNQREKIKNEAENVTTISRKKVNGRLTSNMTSSSKLFFLFTLMMMMQHATTQIHSD